VNQNVTNFFPQKQRRFGGNVIYLLHQRKRLIDANPDNQKKKRLQQQQSNNEGNKLI